AAAPPGRRGSVTAAYFAARLSRPADWLVRERRGRFPYTAMDAGMLVRNAGLGTTLGDIARNGINGFYRGEVAAAIVAAIKQREGLVTSQDLAMHRSQWVEPIAFPYRDVVVYQLPPPTVGLTAASMAVRLEAGQDFRTARDASYALRDRYITDPDFAIAPTDAFLDTHRDLAGRVDATQRAAHTIYLCAADEQGNVVSLIQSVAYDFGSGIVAEGT